MDVVFETCQAMLPQQLNGVEGEAHTDQHLQTSAHTMTTPAARLGAKIHEHCRPPTWILRAPLPIAGRLPLLPRAARPRAWQRPCCGRSGSTPAVLPGSAGLEGRRLLMLLLQAAGCQGQRPRAADTTSSAVVRQGTMPAGWIHQACRPCLLLQGVVDWGVGLMYRGADMEAIQMMLGCR